MPPGWGVQIQTDYQIVLYFIVIFSFQVTAATTLDEVLTAMQHEEIRNLLVVSQQQAPTVTSLEERTELVTSLVRMHLVPDDVIPAVDQFRAGFEDFNLVEETRANRALMR